jgi:hypothetical protein
LTQQAQEVAVYGLSVIILVWNSQGELQQVFVRPEDLFRSKEEANISIGGKE